MNSPTLHVAAGFGLRLVLLLLTAYCSPLTATAQTRSLSYDTNGELTLTQSFTVIRGLLVTNAPLTSNAVVRALDLWGGTNAVLGAARTYTDGGTNALQVQISVATNSLAALVFGTNALQVQVSALYVSNGALRADFSASNALWEARLSPIFGSTQSWNTVTQSLTNAIASAGLLFTVTDRSLAVALDWGSINATNDSRYNMVSIPCYGVQTITGNQAIIVNAFSGGGSHFPIGPTTSRLRSYSIIIRLAAGGGYALSNGTMTVGPCLAKNYNQGQLSNINAQAGFSSASFAEQVYSGMTLEVPQINANSSWMTNIVFAVPPGLVGPDAGTNNVLIRSWVGQYAGTAPLTNVDMRVISNWLVP